VGTSIKKGFILGFKNWGSTFAMIIVLGVATVVISFVFGLPYTIWTLTHLGQSDAVSYILGGISSLSEAFVTPLVFVFLAFQYFSIAENEEGISLQSKVEEFDNL
jgi:Zn-dependent M28 family amino/carboxypeptidase